ERADQSPGHPEIPRGSASAHVGTADRDFLRAGRARRHAHRRLPPPWRAGATLGRRGLARRPAGDGPRGRKPRGPHPGAAAAGLAARAAARPRGRVPAVRTPHDAACLGPRVTIAATLSLYVARQFAWSVLG